MEGNGGEFESSLFGYIDVIQYYQLNMFCLMIASADALPVSVQIYLLLIKNNLSDRGPSGCVWHV